jgi:phage terminase large subunit GpA-like protein
MVEWADQERYLSPEGSATPGKFYTSTVEAARGPMLAVTDPKVKKITVMGPTQLLKTELINNIVAYHIAEDPCPIVVMQPDYGLAETWSKDRFDPMVRDNPCLRGLIKDKRQRDSGNEIFRKAYPGGQCSIVSAGSASDVASRPVKIVCCDEVDKYKAIRKEGDPIKLITERTDTFVGAKIICVCSPTVDGSSRIQAEYNESDKRVFCGRCPHCDQLDHLKWENVHWENNDPLTAYYKCGQCQKPWTEIERLKAISKAEYVATAPFKGHAGFHVNKIASPFKPLSDLVEKFLAAVRSNDPEILKTFWNTQMAECWKEKGEKPDYMRLYERREDYTIGTVPNDNIVFLTAGADVQKDRIECEVVGWCKDRQSFSIDYIITIGETHLPDTWIRFQQAVLDRTYLSPSGRQLQVAMIAVDSGFNTQHVYDWVRTQSALRVRAIKGLASLATITGMPKDVEFNYNGQRMQRAIKLWTVGTDRVKTELYAQLKMNGAGDDGIFQPGFCHFPQYDEQYFKGICAEQLVEKKAKGKVIGHSFEKHFERNEPLDCRVYARAAANMFGLDRFTEVEWQMLLGENISEPEPQQAKQNSILGGDSRRLSLKR